MRSRVLDRFNAARTLATVAPVGGYLALALLGGLLSPVASQGQAAAEGIAVRLAGDAVLLRLTGRLQYDSRVFLEEGTGTTDAVFLRRAAPGVQVTLFDDYALRFTADLSTGRPRPLEASVSARLNPALQLRAGKVLVPVGLAQMQGISNGVLAEHGLGSALAPARDVGVEMRGTVARVLDYSVGVYNGVPDGVSGDLAWSGEKDLVLRGFLRPFATRRDHTLEGLGFGVGGSTGQHRGTADEPFLPMYRTGGRERFFHYRGGSDPVIADGTRQRYSPQAYLYSGRLGMLAEYLVSTGDVRRDTEAGRFSSQAWQAVGSWVVTGEDAAYMGIDPSTSFNPRAGTWGAVEVAVRADGLRADADTFPRFSDPAASALSARSLTGGVNWHPSRNIRVLVNYQTTWFGAAPGADARPTEKALVSRVQLGI
ncbi:MAG: hypothetical protein KY464_14325 [Gemmatimonadetes bacterium]|nr:hypothetical protein [Gemmatimonadota bacterium]